MESMNNKLNTSSTKIKCNTQSYDSTALKQNKYSRSTWSTAGHHTKH